MSRKCCLHDLTIRATTHFPAWAHNLRSTWQVAAHTSAGASATTAATAAAASTILMAAGATGATGAAAA